MVLSHPPGIIYPFRNWAINHHKAYPYCTLYRVPWSLKICTDKSWSKLTSLFYTGVCFEKLKIHIVTVIKKTSPYSPNQSTLNSIRIPQNQSTLHSIHMPQTRDPFILSISPKPEHPTFYPYPLNQRSLHYPYLPNQSALHFIHIP